MNVGSSGSLRFWRAQSMHCVVSLVTYVVCTRVAETGCTHYLYNKMWFRVETPGHQVQDPTVKDSPHPQASFMFGFLNANRALGGGNKG